MPIKNFEQALLATHGGVAVACNIIDSEVKGIVPRSTLVEFMSLCRAQYAMLAFEHHSAAVDRVPDLMKNMLDPSSDMRLAHSASGADFSFLLAGSMAVDPEDLTTAMLAGVLERFFDDATRKRLKSRSVPFPFSTRAPSGSFQADQLMRSNPSQWRLTLGPSGMGSRAIWVTKCAAIEPELEAASNKADELRDLLGLVHRKQGDVVVSVTMPPATFDPGRRAARPTLFDGGNSRFTSDAKPAGTPLDPGWGCTFDLRLLETMPPAVNRMPERVIDHQPVDGFVGQATSFVPRGVVRVPRGDEEGKKDESFSKYMRDGRTLPTLQTALELLV